MKLRLLSREDLQDLMTSPYLASSVVLPRTMCVLEKYVDDQDPDYLMLDQIMRNVLLTLRLFKGGQVRAGPMFFVVLSEDRHLQLKSSSLEPIPDFFVHYYELSIDEIPSLKRMLEKVRAVDFAEQRSLDIACKRFERALLDERDAENRLIDLIIGFEALFLKGRRGFSPSVFEVADVCSRLLGKSYEEREEIGDSIIIAYSIRNHIVHGTKYIQQIPCKPWMYHLPALASRIEGYLRESIKRFLDLDLITELAS